MLKVSNIWFGYDQGDILRGASLNLEKGEILSIVGYNGAGKTTLLKCIAGIIKPQRGMLQCDDQDLMAMERKKLARLVGYMSQDCLFRFPLSVFETVLMGRWPHMGWRPSKRDLILVSEILHTMAIEQFALRDVRQLSGGQLQKVLLARALVQETDYLLLDEPTSNLDLKHQIDFMTMVSRDLKAKNIGTLVAMHDLNLASRFSDRMAMIKEGKIFRIGVPEEVMNVENIKAVYDIDVHVKQENGYPYIIPA